MVSGSNNIVRVNGQAKITFDNSLISIFNNKNTHPKTVILINVHEVYFQCARALMRSNLWATANQSTDLPSPGQILKEIKIAT